MQRRFLLLLSLGLIIVSCLGDEKVEEEYPINKMNLKEGDVLTSNQYTNMPDMENPDSARRLKCGVCHASVMEMAYGILKMETDKRRKLTEVEVVEILENTCENTMDTYGLILDKDGNPSHDWSKDPKPLKAKGGWVTRLALGTCSDIYNEYEEYLIREAPRTCKIVGNERKCLTEKLVDHVCSGLKLCPKIKSPDRANGDVFPKKTGDEDDSEGFKEEL